MDGRRSRCRIQGYWDEYMNLGHQGRWRSQLITCFPGTWHGVNAFDCYGDGIELFSRQDVREGAFDRVRHLVERCDYLQVSFANEVCARPEEFCCLGSNED